MPKIKLKKATKKTVDSWYKKKRDYSITDNEIAKSLGLTRRRVSQALNRYEVNPNDIELLNKFFNTL
jgi:hypothetical protein